MNNLKEVESFCKDLVKEYLPYYSFKFNNRFTSKTYGRCNNTIRLIEMSTKLALRGKQEDIINNVLHEIAHGLAPGNGHGTFWKMRCRQLGIEPTRCNVYEGVFEEKSYNYKIVCGQDHTAGLYTRKPRILNELEKYYCKRCGRKSIGTLQLIELS